MAGELDDLTAMLNLGAMYTEEQNYIEAVEWYRKAADLGDEEAMFRVGSMYENGEGVEKDIQKAKELYSMSAEKGYEEAKKVFERLHPPS
jgi:hypothetical protein